MQFVIVLGQIVPDSQVDLQKQYRLLKQIQFVAFHLISFHLILPCNQYIKSI